MSIKSDTAVPVSDIQWAELQHADYQFNRPFDLVLEKERVFHATQVLRVLPKKRLVAFGVWNDRPAVIKIFFDRKQALRHRDLDVAGMKMLHLNNIPAPALWYEGVAHDKRLHVVVYERIIDAVSLYDIWRSAPDVNALEPVLKAVVIELATQHVLGVLQQDCHLKNFLITDKAVITLDGGQIQASTSMIGKAESMDNLALFFSQLGAGVDALCDALFLYYAKSRGWLLKKEDITDLQLLIKKHDRIRWMQYDKKLQRASSAHYRFQSLKQHGLVERRYLGDEMKAFLKDPDSVFLRNDAVILKKGRSSTVVQVTLDEQLLVIKRYNLKNIWHRLRRSLRVTRAMRCWHLAHKLHLFHVATAKPVAVIERSLLGLRGRSYFVTECIPGVDLGAFCSQKTAQDEAVQIIAPRVIKLFDGLKSMDVSHGDLKKTNILINAQAYPVIIDLDGAKVHTTKTGLRQAWRSEFKRFLANFNNQPTIKALFKTLMDG